MLNDLQFSEAICGAGAGIFFRGSSVFIAACLTAAVLALMACAQG